MPQPILDAVRHAMESSGVTQSEMSRKTGIPLRTLQRWFEGSPPAALDDLAKIFDALGMTIR